MKHTINAAIMILAVGFLFNPVTSTLIYSQNKSMKPMQKSGKSLTFSAELSGKNVVPPVKTNATGSAEFTFGKTGDIMHYIVHLKNIDSVSMAHIHHASKGKNGPIAVWLFKGKVVNIKDGILSQGNITSKDVNLDSLKTWMVNGDTYVLIHTVKNPEGEIRGQIHKSNGLKVKH
jgi:CHRD domain